MTQLHLFEKQVDNTEGFSYFKSNTCAVCNNGTAFPVTCPNCTQRNGSSYAEAFKGGGYLLFVFTMFFLTHFDLLGF